jgi:PKD repeat protein
MKKFKNLTAILLICLAGCFLGSCTGNKSVKNKLTVDFSVDKRPANIGDTIKFTNNSTNFTGIQWDFGDGVTSSDINPVHSYSSSGTFYPTLKVSNSKESAETNLKIDIVPENRISISDTIIITGKEISIGLTGRGPVMWKIGENVLKVADFVNYTFPLPGSYKVEIIDPVTKSLIDSKEVSVTNAPPPPPPPPPDTQSPPPPPPPARKILTASVSPLSCFTGDKITFTTNSDNAVVWDFGGKNVSEALQGEVSFDDPEKYTITLKDKASEKIIKTWVVTIAEKVDNAKFSAWLTTLANPLASKERKDLRLKVFGYCINDALIPISGWDGGNVFKDFVANIMMLASQYEEANITANIQVNGNNKVITVDLVSHTRRKTDK